MCKASRHRLRDTRPRGPRALGAAGRRLVPWARLGRNPPAPLGKAPGTWGTAGFLEAGPPGPGAFLADVRGEDGFGGRGSCIASNPAPSLQRVGVRVPWGGRTSPKHPASSYHTARTQWLPGGGIWSNSTCYHDDLRRYCYCFDLYAHGSVPEHTSGDLNGNTCLVQHERYPLPLLSPTEPQNLSTLQVAT